MSIPADVLLSFQGVTASYGKRPVFTGLSLDVRRGSFILLSGSNGGGKTTLLRLMLGLLRPTAGRIVRAKGLLVGYQPQYQRLDRQFPLTVRDFVLTGMQNRLRLWQRLSDHQRLQAEELLRRIDLSELASRSVSQLSGGQLQRALFARAVVSDPDLLVLDEPDTYLDAHHRQMIYDFLAHIGPQTAVVMVSHDPYAQQHLGNVHLLVDHGVQVLPLAP